MARGQKSRGVRSVRAGIRGVERSGRVVNHLGRGKKSCGGRGDGRAAAAIGDAAAAAASAVGDAAAAAVGDAGDVGMLLLLLLEMLGMLGMLLLLLLLLANLIKVLLKTV